MISCVMSVYNEERWMIMRAVESVVNQTIPVDEIIVVCDNPQDLELVNWLEGYLNNIDMRTVLLVNDRNRGLAYSLNRGISVSKGDWICRMDADDESMPSRIEKSLLLQKANGLDIVTTQITVVNEQGEKLPKQRKKPCSYEAIKAINKYAPCVFHPTWLFKKSIWEEIGGYREAMIAAQDYDFILRALKQGCKIESTPSSELNYTERTGSISGKNTAKQLFLGIYAQNNVLRNQSFDDSISEQIRSNECLEYIQFKSAVEPLIQSTGIVGRILAIIKGWNKSMFFRRHVINTVMQRILSIRYTKE